MSLRAVLFDSDGTVADSADLHARQSGSERGRRAAAQSVQPCAVAPR